MYPAAARRMVEAVKWLLPLVLVVALGPSWDIGGRWTSAIGTLELSQRYDGTVVGRFTMSAGCTQTYDVSGRVEESRVDLSLELAGGDQPPCAGSQTLKGTVGAGGTTMSLALANPHRSSPATPFIGKATPVKAASPTPPAPAKTKPSTSASGGTTRSATFTAGGNCTSTGQNCSAVWSHGFVTKKGPMTVSFVSGRGHCSDVRLHFRIGTGAETTSSWLLGPLKASPTYTLQIATAGSHTLYVRAEGRRGGCNTGRLVGWGGTLRVTYVG